VDHEPRARGRHAHPAQRSHHQHQARTCWRIPSVARHPRSLQTERDSRLVWRNAGKWSWTRVQCRSGIAPRLHQAWRREPERSLLGARHRDSGVDNGCEGDGAGAARPVGDWRGRGRESHRRADGSHADDRRAMMDAPEAIRPLFGSGVAGALRNLRRDLHRHPELSWHEEGTALRLTRALNELGVADVTRVAGTGLIARVPGRVRTGGAVAVRGDIDALPITESTNLPFTSETAGVMHACGHDVHASWAVGAARLLVDHPA